jgi:hypothetical protein
MLHQTLTFVTLIDCTVTNVVVLAMCINVYVLVCKLTLVADVRPHCACSNCRSKAQLQRQHAAARC